jgi:hypothetical protein
MIKVSYGAKIKFKIDFDQDLKELGATLSKGLGIPEFWYDTREDPPHELVGYCETFGFEIEIENYKNNGVNSYLFIASTTNSLEETAEGRIYDLSIWFAKHVALSCELQTSLL